MSGVVEFCYIQLSKSCFSLLLIVIARLSFFAKWVEKFEKSSRWCWVHSQLENIMIIQI